MTLAPLSPSSLLPWLPWLSGSLMQQHWNIWYNPPFTKDQCFLCCCHHKPAWCLLLAPPSATEISSLSGTPRRKRQKRLACAYVGAGNFANGIIFTPLDHLQPNYSPLWHLYLWAIRPDRFQQERSNSVVNVSLEGWFKILGKIWRWRCCRCFKCKGNKKRTFD